MSKLLKLLALPLVIAGAAGAVAPAAIRAAGDDQMACSVSVEYSLNNVVRQTYIKDFEVGETTPFSDDFSTATRFKFFDASMTRQSGIPVVSISYFADVTVFNSLDFSTSLKVKDETHGETTSGENTFYQGGATPGTHRTSYTLTCQRAAN